MILTVTLNPSVDISYKLTKLALDGVNRIDNVSKTAGGKGLNVSRVLKQLDQQVGATGFLGGSLGMFIQTELATLGVDDYFVAIEEPTRNCIAIIHDGGQQTEILEGGPTILAEEANIFLRHFQEAIQQVELITISGSLPQGLPNNYYNQLLTIASQQNKPVLLDTSSVLLDNALNHRDKPFLVKPNEAELADLLGQTINDEIQLVKALSRPIFEGIEWVIVTLGSEGAVIKNHSRVYRASIPKIEAVNPVGSGDSVIAGFATGLARGLSGVELIKFGLAMGVLNAMEEKTGAINPDKIAWCVGQIRVEGRS
ncbi:hexose kinase [Amphibacillus sp. Q70]|uniref:hexose kinase n=1 Tax=Amphibacillus sp. Q70 TaxID=3453416 RepID=UPI003F85B43A